jgi:hypothetical protein
LDAGLARFVQHYFDVDKIIVVPHPINTFAINESSNKKIRLDDRRLVFYQYGHMSDACRSSFDMFTRQLDPELKLYFRGQNISVSTRALPRFLSIVELFDFLRTVKIVVVPACDQYRLTASGFLVDALSLGCSVFVHDNFHLSFSQVCEQTDGRLVRYRDYEDLLVLVEEAIKGY